MRTCLLLLVAVAGLAAGPAAQPGLAGLPADRPATLPELRAALGTPTQLRIEIDYMVEYNGDGTVNHSHRPTTAEVNAVVQMFACQGITLTIVVDDEIPHRDVLIRDPLNPNNFFGYNNGANTFGGIREDHFDRGVGWHYGVFAHQYQDSDYQTTGSSGLGERPGNDFIVTLGSFTGEIGTAWDRAATLAHEFGHNLGLRHTGASALTGNHVMSLPSIMSYSYQLVGVRAGMQCLGMISESGEETLFKNLDFSHGRGCPITESSLSEARGLGIVPVDWNCDGATSGTVSQNTNGDDDGAGWCGSSGPIQNLSDYDEWSNIVDVAALDASRYVSEEETCVTASEAEAFRTAADARRGAAGGCVQATLTNESCRSRQMIYLRDAGSIPLGTCWSPVRSLAELTPFLGNGNIIYASPGSYPTTGTVLDGPVQILGPGGAVFGD